MKKGKGTIGFFMAGLLLAATSARAADEPRTKGYCRISEGESQAFVRIDSGNEQNGQDAWRAELGQGVVAAVRFTPGYGMTFVHLVLREGTTELAESTLWIDGFIRPDSEQHDGDELRPMERFNTVSLTMLTAVGKVHCGYGLYR